jgi:transposase InsO family protein
MREAGLCGRQKGRYRVQTTDSHHDQPIAPNLMAAVPTPTAPNQIWVGDITYIETQEGWLFLAAILDRYSRKIVGWAMSERIDTTLVLKAFDMALLHRQPTTHVLFHSDRGVQYASADYRRALTQAGLVASMSRKGNCYDNATMESFWSTLKLELIYRRKFATRSEARSQIFEFIECFYNRQRAHSALDYRSPVSRGEQSRRSCGVSKAGICLAAPPLLEEGERSDARRKEGWCSQVRRLRSRP